MSPAPRVTITHPTAVTRWAAALTMLVALAWRLPAIFQQPAHLDEAMLAKELAAINLRYLPVHFVGFGWGENVMLAYLTYPGMKLFSGVDSVLLLRLLAFAAYGVFAVVLYLLAREMFGPSVAAISLLFAAISPWGFRASTVAFNAHLIPLLLTGAALCWVQGYRRRRTIFFSISSLLFGLSLYTYASSFVVVPLLALLLWWCYRPRLAATVTAAGIFGVLSLPIALFYLKNELHFLDLERFLGLTLPTIAPTRFDGVSIFALYDGFRVAGQYAFNYLIHFTLLGLVFDARMRLRWFAFTYWWDIAFLIIGAAVVFNKSFSHPPSRFLLLWLLLGPLASSFVDSTLGYSATRDIHLLPGILLLSAIGCRYVVAEVILKITVRYKKPALPGVTTGPTVGIR